MKLDESGVVYLQKPVKDYDELLSKKDRCDQFYQHIFEAMSPEYTYWHTFNMTYMESDPDCYDDNYTITDCRNRTEYGEPWLWDEHK